MYNVHDEQRISKNIAAEMAFTLLYRLIKCHVLKIKKIKMRSIVQRQKIDLILKILTVFRQTKVLHFTFLFLLLLCAFIR